LISELDAPGGTDSTAKQQSFADQYKLPYRIISDAEESARKAYKVDKAFMGLVPGESRLI
jgi:peroxiredoxin